ncbi:uncharacterized protein PITG_22571 [Phytophthora infestans T30-4]|uniref:Uncharacterized protein n=1 Tax=Phytophthora infestans (strain T30-4) TaxID=403677 RepID=D0RMJ2_PHYIT|nr:uncharacterized protein PITG_22571 [Phytophthora infestans T30-4]EEY64419.1 conserved hypothetical protein [Phytophthora infestans T30-4]|eukprot:XP_002909738.1 conserved hypothetical protein [Phytophthora infestans T30-4]
MHSSSAKQRACPIRHSPKFYCCEYSGTTTVVYTKYNRPVGGDYESFYIDGWNKQRQVNYPYVITLMLRDDSVDSDLKDACISTSTTTTPHFTSYTETPLVIIYFLP